MNPVLEQVVQLLAESPALNLQIDRFCDDSCSYEESFKLADTRVKAVSDYLSARGIGPKRFFCGSSGNTHMAVPSASEEGRAFNRRVELRPTY
jgi:outer membrane protein OmpA-like peptidoglycan-associated protein